MGTRRRPVYIQREPLRGRAWFVQRPPRCGYADLPAPLSEDAQARVLLS